MAHGGYDKVARLGVALIGLIIPLLFLHRSLADFEVCNPDVSTVIYKFTKANCPHGVLFYHPISAVCLASTSSEGHFISDLCEPENYTIKPKEDNSTEPYKVQLVFVMDEEPVDDQNSCSGTGEDRCNITELVEVSTTTMTEPGVSTCDYDEEEGELSEEDKARRHDTQVFNQTERMFKYMLGLSNDKRNDEYINTRLLKLFRQCFKILAKFCDTRYVPADFGKDVLKAFLFLLRESDLTGFRDISVDNYEAIKNTLDECEKSPPTFSLVGNSCKTCPNAYSVQKMGQSLRYIPNEFSFAWGKYDVPVDATFGAINFVHGKCYGTYRPNVNSHHHFQREVERLFTKEIMYRWARPVILNHEDLWDHLFSSNIKNTMRNLDACIFGAYHGTPFQHPLERPFIKREEKKGSDSDDKNAGPDSDDKKDSGSRRRKRALPTMTLDDGGLERAGWCFQTEEDLLLTTEAYVNAHCPSNRKALEEVKEVVKCVASSPPASDEGGGGDSKSTEVEDYASRD